MVIKSLVVLSFIAAAVAEPIPQVSPAATTSFPPFDTTLPSSLAFLEACLSSEEALLSGLPTYPTSLEMILATVVPSSVFTETGCALQTAIEGYYASLPPSVVSAISSYNSEAESWYAAHSSQLAALASSCAPSGTGAASYTFSSINVPICTGGAQPGSTATGTGTKTTGTTSAKTTAGSTGTGTGGSSTATGSVASTSKSTGVAAPTGAITFGAAGVVGLLGLLVAL
jgi:hypothetical protein